MLVMHHNVSNQTRLYSFHTLFYVFSWDFPPSYFLSCLVEIVPQGKFLGILLNIILLWGTTKSVLLFLLLYFLNLFSYDCMLIGEGSMLSDHIFCTLSRIVNMKDSFGILPDSIGIGSVGKNQLLFVKFPLVCWSKLSESILRLTVP